jgi:hypothetical protein
MTKERSRNDKRGNRPDREEAEMTDESRRRNKEVQSCCIENKGNILHQ